MVGIFWDVALYDIEKNLGISIAYWIRTIWIIVLNILIKAEKNKVEN